jgi:hypothetical protein
MLIELLVDWLVISVACGCILTFLVSRAEAQASKEWRLPSFQEWEYIPPPLEFSRPDDCLYNFDADPFRRREDEDMLHPGAAVDADGRRITDVTFAMSQTPGRRPSPFTAAPERGMRRRSGRAQLYRVPAT